MTDFTDEPFAGRPKLTKDDLHAIGERNKGNKDVVALIWDIARLRSHVLRMDQYFRSKGSTSAPQILNWLEQEIADEPCVREVPKLDSTPTRIMGGDD